LKTEEEPQAGSLCYIKSGMHEYEEYAVAMEEEF
jgi:hypothetical protein